MGERPGRVGIGMLGIDVGKVGRIGKLIGGVKIGRVGTAVGLVTLGTPEKLGVGMLNTGTLGPGMLGRPLVMFGNTGAGLGKPGMLLPVIRRTGVVADMLLLLMMVVRLPTSSGLDGSVGPGAGGTIGGCAGGVSPEHSETEFGKPPIPPIMEVGSTGGEARGSTGGEASGSTGGEARGSTGGEAREGGIGAEVGMVGRNGVRNGGNVAAGSEVTKMVSILQTSNTSLACLFN